MINNKITYSFLITISCFLYIGCSKKQEKLNFIKFNDKIHSPHSMVFIVEHYQDNKDSERQIDSFNLKLATDSILSTIGIDFYRSSEITNLKHLKENPKDFKYSYEDDYIFKYYLSKGRISGKYKIRNGKLISPSSSDVEVVDPPPLKN